MARNYPVIFVHGLYGWGQGDKLYAKLPYWGASNSRELTNYFGSMGIEAFAPSVGPLSSAWDRCCELWAFLMGGTVDYGKYHSEKCGHARYGRTYEHGALEDWGLTDEHKKINIVGHSFGGPTVKMFADIIAFGAQAEIDCTPEEELSDFFKANKPQKLHTVTTLSGVNNGTSFASMFGVPGMTYVATALLLVTAVLGESKVMDWYDIRLDQFGIMPDPTKLTKKKFNIPLKKKYIDAIKGFTKLRYDNIAYELGVEEETNTNALLGTPKDVYFFARRASCYYHDKKGKMTKANKDKFPASPFLGGACKFSTYLPYVRKLGVDKTWQDNDGIVNVVGQSAPLNAPQKDYKEGMKIKPGIWYNMPVEMRDHLCWSGLFDTDEGVKTYYGDMVKSFAELPEID